MYPSKVFLADIWPGRTAGASDCWNPTHSPWKSQCDRCRVAVQPMGTTGGTRMRMLRVTEMVMMTKKRGSRSKTESKHFRIEKNYRR